MEKSVFLILFVVFVSLFGDDESVWIPQEG